MSSIHLLNLKGHSAKLLAEMSEMRDSGILTDVSLKVGEQIFKAHRVVLAASSDYFSAMFTAGMKESFEESIELKDSSVTPDSLKIILDAVYKSELMVTEENVFEILEAADHLQMTSIIEQCSKYLSKEIVSAQLQKLDDLQSLQKVLDIAEKQSFFELQEDVFTKMAVAFKKLSDAEEFPELLSVGQMLNLLQRNSLTAPSETFVFRAVVKWIYHNKEERLSHAAELFKAIRLGLVEFNVLITELRRKELKEDEECKLLFEASLYNHKPTLLPELPLIKTEPRALAKVLVAIEPDLPLKYYDVTNKVWQEYGQNIPIKHHCTSVVSFGNFIFVGSNQKVYRYSIDNNYWDELPSMILMTRSAYWNYQLFVLGEYLYAFGDEIAERYSFSEKTWQECAKVGNGEWTWAALDGCIYAVGNSEIYMFDESKNIWMQKSDNLSNSACYTWYAFGYKGKLIIEKREAPCEPSTVIAYCKKSNRWTEVTQNHLFPFPLWEIVVDNTVFFRLNNFFFDTGIKVSPDVSYSPSLSKWGNLTDLAGGELITSAPLNTNKLL